MAKRIRLTGFQSRKREGGSDDTFALQVRSKGFPTFAAVKEPLDSAKPVALNTPLQFAKDGNGPSVCSQGGPSRKRGAFGLMAIMPHCWFR